MRLKYSLLASLVASTAVAVAIGSSLEAAPTVHTDRGVDAVQAVEVDGVWVFQHDPAEVSNDALHSGTPAIVNGCLVIDDAVVIWPSDQIDQAEHVVSGVLAGDVRSVTVSGGGLSLDEGATPDQLPGAVVTQCAADAVWFAAA